MVSTCSVKMGFCIFQLVLAGGMVDTRASISALGHWIRFFEGLSNRATFGLDYVIYSIITTAEGDAFHSGLGLTFSLNKSSSSTVSYVN